MQALVLLQLVDVPVELPPLNADTILHVFENFLCGFSSDERGNDFRTERQNGRSASSFLLAH